MRAAPATATEHQVLKQVLAINAAMFATEVMAGFAAGSVGLIADGLDMLADALVYGLALAATTRGPTWHLTSARWSGHLQVLLGVGVLAESVRRFLMPTEPVGLAMIGIGMVALGANILCLVLLNRFRHGRVHMRAAWIFSTNDVIANLGVVASGGLVLTFGSRFPDLIIGSLIATIVIRGGLRINRDTRRESARLAGPPGD